MEKFIAEEEPTVDELRRAIRARHARQRRACPVLCGSAFKNKGVQLVLDAVVQYLPAPARRAAARGPQALQRGRRDPAQARRRRAVQRRSPSRSCPTRTSGRLTYLRDLLRRPALGLARPELHEGPQGAHRPHPADAREPPRGPGRRVHRRHRGRGGPQALHHRRHDLRPGRSRWSWRPISFPTPVISVAVEPKTKADQDKLGTGLGKLSDEDPTFIVKYDDETGQTVISGMGELHLDIIVDRLKREFSVDANVGKPQVAYRETIRKHGAQGRGPVRPPDRRQGPVRARLHRPRAHGPRRRLRVHQQGRRRQDPARVHPRRSTRASRVRSTTASWPATPWWTSAPRWSTAASTRSTPRRWPSRSPAPWP